MVSARKRVAADSDTIGATTRLAETALHFGGAETLAVADSPIVSLKISARISATDTEAKTFEEPAPLTATDPANLIMPLCATVRAIGD